MSFNWEAWIDNDFHRGDSNDLKDLVEESLGVDMKNVVSDLIDLAEHNKDCMNADLRYYEDYNSDLTNAMVEIKDIAEDLILYLENAKRINRKSIKDRINNIIYIIINNI